MDEILRVDHAGEYAAVLIYRAQKAVFEGRKDHGDMVRDLGDCRALGLPEGSARFAA